MGEIRQAGARSLDAPFRSEESLPVPHLRLVPDTLETLLTRVVATLRSSLPDPEAVDSAFAHACRRDAIAVIDAGQAAGLLHTHRRPATGRE
jgi:hypothetical protein